MRLTAENGDELELVVTGYQFPDATDARVQCSWHMVSGKAHTRYGTWTFRYQALTCDESPQLAHWLRGIASWVDDTARTDAPRWTSHRQRPGRLEFTEPDLRLRVEGVLHGRAVVVAELDAEFRPPWHLPPSGRIGDKYWLRLVVSAEQLRHAADDWEREIAPFPDCIANPALLRR